MIAKKRKAGSIGLNLTSMIDVVFLLLIYFMVATEFKSAEESFPMDVPARNHGESISLDSEPLVIFVESSGNERGDVRIRLEGPWEPVSSLQELASFLHKNQVKGVSNRGLFATTHPILVKPTRTTLWEHAISTYNTVVRAKFTNISLDEPL